MWHDKWVEAEKAVRKVDPVIFDLNSDGKYASNIADGVYFDYDGDGFREKTAWADK